MERAFTETQGYGLTFFILAAVSLLPVVIIMWRYRSRKPGKGTLLLLITPFLLAGYFSTEKVETRIDNTGIHYRMFPLQMSPHDLQWDDIQNIEIVKRGNIANSSRAHIYMLMTSSRYALDIKCKDGKRIILGTRLPNEIDNALLALANSGALPQGLTPDANTYISHAIAE